MALTILTALDLVRNELRNLVLHMLASAPSAPVEGQVYYDSTLKRVRWWSGTTWIDPTERATHSGTQPASTISDLAATVQAYRLDQFAPPQGPVSLGGQRLTNVAAPTAATDAATKAYVDTAVAGWDWKASVRVATTTNLTLSGPQTVDGVAVQVGDRVLVRAQTDARQNGLYVVASGAWTRAPDAALDSQVTPGLAVFVEEGTQYHDTVWLLTTDAPIVLGTTPLTFTQVATADVLQAGAGLTRTGNTFDVGAGVGIQVTADAVAIDPAVVPRRVHQTVGNGTDTAIAVTHNLGTRDVLVQVYRNSTPWDTVWCDIERTDSNTVTVRFAQAPAANAYRVVIFG